MNRAKTKTYTTYALQLTTPFIITFLALFTVFSLLPPLDYPITCFTIGTITLVILQTAFTNLTK